MAPVAPVYVRVRPACARATLVCVTAALLLCALPHRALADGSRFWPVGDRPAVVRPWSPPTTPYGPGHRGVDLSAPIGAPVRAVAAGHVLFAGEVAGRGVLSVELTGTGDPPLRTTYEPVTATVEKGAQVAPGAPVGVLQLPTGHCPPSSPSCLHWGLLRGTTYLDPLSLLNPSQLHEAPARLLPVWGWPQPGLGRSAAWWENGASESPAAPDAEQLLNTRPSSDLARNGPA
ncbi:M23 family metallopeptidase [Streptomyces sp. NPDC102467]|uniref:M23 family metallopeptidase n=1 Tax=Streptomyces sp. NPDC102467 TaxID=3366179 RepID=UPI00382D2BA4